MKRARWLEWNGNGKKIRKKLKFSLDKDDKYVIMKSTGEVTIPV